jgi:hypothetical protein
MYMYMYTRISVISDCGGTIIPPWSDKNPFNLINDKDENCSVYCNKEITDLFSDLKALPNCLNDHFKVI